MSNENRECVGKLVDDILDQLPGQTEEPQIPSAQYSEMMEEAVRVASSVDEEELRMNMVLSLNDPEALTILKAQVAQMHPTLTQEQVDAIFIPENFEQLVNMAMSTAQQLKQ